MTRTIVVEHEREAPRGWVFDVRIDSPIRSACATVHLDWADHEHWSHGNSGPARVVETLVRLLDEHDALDDLGPAFDASTARRRLEGLDDLMWARV